MYERDERRKTDTALVVEGRVVDGVYRVWMPCCDYSSSLLPRTDSSSVTDIVLCTGRETLTSLVIVGTL